MAKIADLAQPFVAVIGVAAAEFAEIVRFAPEKLDHAHAGDGFLQVGVHAREFAADFEEGALGVFAEEEAGGEDHRHGAERHEGETPVDREHKDQHRQQGHEVAGRC